ncbi:T9SS type A sorting domain-containing protein [Arcicella sp. DC2W]|uniref:T9SS type A sorting domain-containing protein n=1 Tax=Arcicella gelida TaxID=2984195 RepID=A0ABU5S428_9BACT|nr:T9SS type A sorting domain-containing protein [Arcicella sp. DC2W]MEA5402978.1 T9SS type A sorting domain-containing protein [Arcicella sp. DC2W]
MTEALYSKNVVFNFDPAYFITNKEKPSLIEVDFGDNKGLRKVKLGENIPIEYQGVGTRVITMRLLLGKKEVFLYTPIHIMTDKIEKPYKTFTVNLTHKSGRQIGQPMGATVAVYIGNGCTPKFDKPVIIVEGFDPSNSISFGELEGRYGSGSFYFNKLWVQGFDRVYVNFNDGGDYIENNADVVAEVIKQVKAERIGNAPTIVIGESMGGVCARMALKKLENQGFQHTVSHYISFDSPHKGANVPPGVQALVRQVDDVGIINLFNISSSARQPALNWLDCPAAKQMLLRSTNQSNGTNAPTGKSTDYTSFYNQLASLGYPSQCKNWAVSCGSNTGLSQTGIYDDIEYVHADASVALVSGFLRARSNNIGSGTNTIASTTILSGAIPTTLKTTDFTNDGINYDWLSGGNYDVSTKTSIDVNTITRTISDIFRIFPVSYLNFSANTKIGFVPTFSSIDYTGSLASQSSLNLNLNTISKGNGTPFDMIFAGSNNEEHIYKFAVGLSSLIDYLPNDYAQYFSCPTDPVPSIATPNINMSPFQFPGCADRSYTFTAQNIPTSNIGRYQYCWTLSLNGNIINTGCGINYTYLNWYFSQSGTYNLTLEVKNILDYPYPTASKTMMIPIAPAGSCINGYGYRIGVQDTLNIDADFYSESNDKLLIFPNPVLRNSQVQINLEKEAQMVSFHITDILGNTIQNVINFQQMTIGKHQFPIELSSHSNGVYLGVLTIDGKTISKKIILNK